ncbi:MAG: lipoate--protein ligase family protein [Treponema sp.]|jgi:lipoate-protein ligase A|nr:lipoate--protein ligase family protein [Treponema sp.]
MALDEALLETVAAGAVPVLRFYGWSPPAVSIGYFQGIEEEVDLEACVRRGIDVVRRISGGGAVFHDAEITYSLIMPLDHPLAGTSIMASYGRLCSGITAGLGLLGIDAAFAPINDIVAGGKKVSGNAQTRRQGCVLQHGTVLLDSDPELMFELLKVPQEKMKGKLIQDIKLRVTGLYALLGRNISYVEARDVLARGFRDALSLDYVSGPAGPSPSEEARAGTLVREKFGSRAWLRRR